MGSEYRIICGDCATALKKLPAAKCVFADPPDNIDQSYGGLSDNLSKGGYYGKMVDWVEGMLSRGQVVWLSINQDHGDFVDDILRSRIGGFQKRRIIWRFKFGQYRTTDLACGYRPIIRLVRNDASLFPGNILVPSLRQTKYRDKRAVLKGRVPDDVWEFPRVCGTFKEHRKWHPNQHPEALVERAVLLSTQPGDLVIDPFGGSGTTLRVCKKLNRRCYTIEASREYCDRISDENKVKVEQI